jgi:hypothetical protein
MVADWASVGSIPPFPYFLFAGGGLKQVLRARTFLSSDMVVDGGIMGILAAVTTPF